MQLVQTRPDQRPGMEQKNAVQCRQARPDAGAARSRATAMFSLHFLMKDTETETESWKIK